MEAEFINLTEKNIDSEHLCCIIRSKNRIPARFIEVCSLEQAKGLPCVFNNFAVFNRGRFVTVNPLDPAQLRKLAAK